MSQYSLDSLDNDSSYDNQFSTGLRKRRNVTLVSEKLEQLGQHGEVNELLTFNRTADYYTDTDAGFNERPKEGLVILQPRDSEKFRGNALIAIAVDAAGKCCPSEEKLVVTEGATLDFRVQRPFAKKFDMASRSSSSAAEFRLRVSQVAGGKSPDVIEGFMKAGKKAGKVRRSIVDRDKKEDVSYLELHRRKFGVERRRCIPIPEGSTPPICGDRRNARVLYGDERASGAVSGDDDSEVGFYRRLMELDSREPRETRSCEALDRSGRDEPVSKSNSDVSEYFSDLNQPAERTRRVLYKPYSIQDYKCLSVPEADRSLGPDRIEMESKGEWLMRRRSYGDSVSARNRQRILHRAQKLKASRRVHVQKTRLPPLTDAENPAPVSKVDDQREGTRIIAPDKIPPRSKATLEKRPDVRAPRFPEFPLLVAAAKSDSSNPKRDSKLPPKLPSGFPNLCETHSDAPEHSMLLRKLRQRHLEEKKRMDQLFKRTLCA